MSTTWILVADSSRADIYRSFTVDGSLQLVMSLEHMEGREHMQNLTSDLPGRHSDHAGLGRHAFTDEIDPKEQEAIDFAKDINQRLNIGRINHLYDQLIIAAAPHFLGYLREYMDKQTSRLVTHELDKHLTQMKPKELQNYLIETI